MEPGALIQTWTRTCEYERPDVRAYLDELVVGTLALLVSVFRPEGSQTFLFVVAEGGRCMWVVEWRWRPVQRENECGTVAS